jgi:hypothetical protein
MAGLPSGLPDTIQDDEPIARFLTQSSHFSTKNVDPSAFLPGKRDRETSVSRHGREPLESLQSLGLAVVEASDRKLHGAAIILGRDIHQASLGIKPDEPPERHAVIQGWPWLENDPRSQKAQQKERAIILASAAGAPVLFSHELPIADTFADSLT